MKKKLVAKASSKNQSLERWFTIADLKIRRHYKRIKKWYVIDCNWVLDDRENRILLFPCLKKWYVTDCNGVLDDRGNQILFPCLESKYIGLKKLQDHGRWAAKESSHLSCAPCRKTWMTLLHIGCHLSWQPSWRLD